ncbi:MAG: 3-methyl-2-oxobutanoate hydroxymethyltransferase [Candidatus Omnitrophica bacterium]|nr:3-methyl-2-oxobutanoate hydroxymethyltransferase [Candidatus Omnitrophota bacterium]
MPNKIKKNMDHKIVMLTAYDYPTARIADRAGVDIVLVGDSLANVVLGLDATSQVGMDVMLHHAKAVCRGVESAMVVVDMPVDAMQGDSLKDARKLIEAGCDAVKIEWSAHCLEAVKAICSAGIAVMGHVGLTPQTAQEFKVQGRDAASAKLIMDQALAMQETGCFAIVLECVPEMLAQEMTRILKIPTIGIGAGKFCDGQVLVLHDMLGLNDRKVPKFVKQYVDLSAAMASAIGSYKEDVISGKFPGPEHTFH